MTRRLTLLLILLFWACPSWAAIGLTQLTSGGDSTDATSYATASITPTANACVLLTVHSRISVADADGPTTPTATGNSLTWVVVRSKGGYAAPNFNRRQTVFRARGASPSSGTITIDFSGETQTHATWSVTEFTGVDQSGTHCSGGIVQDIGADDGGVNGTTSTGTLTNNISSAANLTYASHVVTSNLTQTVGSGFTQRSHVTEATDGTSHLIQTKLNEKVSTSTWTGNHSWFVITVELKAERAGSFTLMGVGQ
jgi:hypothetical protein